MKKVLSTTILIFLAYIGFSVNTMFAPTLMAPANNAVNQMPNVFLNWSAVPGAFSYKIQVSTDSLFATSKIYSSNLTALNASSLLFNSKYFWRVKGIGVNDSSDWSAYNVFYTINTVTIIRPFNNDTNRLVSAYFKWNAISGINYYQYQMDTSLTFSSPLFVSNIILPNKIDAYSKQLAFGTNYYLRMRAIHSEDTSVWSALTNFKTLDNLSIRKPHNDTTKISPVAKLEWQWVGSRFYEYAISTDSLFNTSLMYTFDTNKVVYQTSPPDTLVRVFTDTLLFYQKYFWKVRAKNLLDTSNWSPVSKFTTIDKMTLLSPANGTLNVSTSPTFSWNSIKSIGHYVLELDDDSTFLPPVSTYILPNNSSTFILSTILPRDKAYFWRMRATTQLDASLWSNIYKFRTSWGIGIETSILNNNSVSIYPNPSFNGRINIQIASSDNQAVNASLMNMIGQEVFNRVFDVKSGDNTFTLDLSNNENGIYFLKLQNTDNTLTRKIILNK
jgi:hypothetical protein